MTLTTINFILMDIKMMTGSPQLKEIEAVQL